MISVTIHGTAKITMRTNRGSSTWLQLTVVDRYGRPSEITLFADDPAMAAKFTAAKEALDRIFSEPEPALDAPGLVAAAAIRQRGEP